MDQEEDSAAGAAASEAEAVDSAAVAVDSAAASEEALIITARTITDRTITVDGFGDPDVITTVAVAALAA